MTRFPAATSDEHTLYAAVELSKKSWLLAIQFHCTAGWTIAASDIQWAKVKIGGANDSGTSARNDVQGSFSSCHGNQR